MMVQLVQNNSAPVKYLILLQAPIGAKPSAPIIAPIKSISYTICNQKPIGASQLCTNCKFNNLKMLQKTVDGAIGAIKSMYSAPFNRCRYITRLLNREVENQ